MQRKCPNQRRRRCRRRHDAVGCLVRSRMLRLLLCPLLEYTHEPDEAPLAAHVEHI